MESYPPFAYLIQVLNHCPQAGSTYVQLWNMRDCNNRVDILIKDVRLEFLISLKKFKHDLLLLVKEGLISVNESQKSFVIELVDWQIDAEGLTLC